MQRRAWKKRPAVEFDGPVKLPIDAAEDFHQRAFARPVFAGEDMHFTGERLQLDAAQHFDAAKALANVAHANQRCADVGHGRKMNGTGRTFQVDGLETHSQ